jgi:rod shape-determining protein MreC
MRDAETRELLLENTRLRRMLAFRERSRFSLLPARVMSHDAELPPTTIVIDVGFADGVKPNLPVMTPDGLVGRIEGRPASRRSVVRLITDPSLRVSTVVENEDRGMGILRWDGLRMRVENVAQEARIQAGDPVVTSGMGGLFPPGILIGKVLKVRDDPHALFKEMIISPGARIDRLEEVFVVRDLSSSAWTTPEAANALGR